MRACVRACVRVCVRACGVFSQLKIIQPEAETPSSSQDSPGGPQGADSPSQEIPSITSTTNPSTSPSSTPAKKKKKDEDPEVKTQS